MSVTYGFYNSLNGDRKYDALQLSKLFDGIIVDGIFASIGTCLVVKADTGLNINVGIGKAWFQRTWTFNDAILPITATISEVLLDRIDAVVLEVNASEAVRANSIKIIQGTPSSTPVNPPMASGEALRQYPLCYIYRAAGSTEIIQANITNMVGTADTPFVTGILQTISLNELLGKWQSELDQFVLNEQTDFTTWFNSIKDILDASTAGNLLSLINTHKSDAEVHISRFNHSKTGTVHNLTGTLSGIGIGSVLFKATSDFLANDTFTVNGEVCVVKSAGEELALSDKAFIAGDLVNVTISGTGKKLFFSSGGGSGGSVVQATAPTNTKLLWIDSATGVMKYYNGTTWVITASVWG